MSPQPQVLPLHTLSAILRGEPPPAIWAGITDDCFIDLLERNAIGPLLYHQLKQTAQLPQWPRRLAEWLAESFHSAVAEEMVRTRELRAVFARLEQAGIPALILKGTALAYSHYGDPSLRPRSDTDLLVQQAQVKPLLVALTEMGYARPNFSGDEQLFYQFPLHRRDASGCEHVLDIHWKISARKFFAGLFTFEELWQQSRALPWLGDCIRGLGDTHALLLSSLHPVMHHHCENRLIWIYDTHLLAGGMDSSEWERFVRLAEEKSVRSICARALGLARDHFHTPIPTGTLERICSPISEQEPSVKYLKEGRRWVDDVASDMAQLKWRERFQLVTEILLPSPHYMLESYGLARQKLALLILPLLYLHRGVRGLLKVHSKVS